MRIPTKLTLPCFLPHGMSGYGAVWAVTGPKQPLLKGAVQQGCPLDFFQLSQLQEALKFPLPAKGKGSGAHGGATKPDYARSLVKTLFPDASEQEHNHMFTGIMGTTAVRKQKVKCPQDVIQAVQLLGKEAESDFRFVHEVALNQEAMEKEEKKIRAAAEAEDAYARRTYTPAELRRLLPPNGWCNRQPVLKRYQAGYIGLLSLKFKSNALVFPLFSSNDIGMFPLYLCLHYKPAIRYPPCLQRFSRARRSSNESCHLGRPRPGID